MGATSPIAEACARLWAERGARLYLAARDRERLSVIATDLKVRGALAVAVDVFDALAFESHPALLLRAEQAMGGLDLVFIAHGSLPNQPRCQNDTREALREIGINALSVVTLLTTAASTWRRSGQGRWR